MTMKAKATIYTMEKCVENLIERIKYNLIQDMENAEYGDDVTLLVLAAYNRYQEDEKDGVDYIFNIHEQDDLICCIKGGMKIGEISMLYNECTKTAKSTPFFMFGHNRESFETFKDWDALKTYLIGFFLDNIIKYMLVYHNTDGYRQLYDHCISGYIINNNLV